MRDKFVSGYDPETGVQNDTLAGDLLWSSANTREAVPDVVTPYTWSALRHGFDQVSMLPGYATIGNICGRVYNNASVGATVFHALGLKTFDASSSELYGVDQTSMDEWDVPLLPFTLADRLTVIGKAMRIIGMVRKTLKDLEKHVIANPPWCEMKRQNLKEMDAKDLAAFGEIILHPKVVDFVWWMVSPAMAQSGVVSKLRRDLLSYVGPEETVILLSNVSPDGQSLASLGPVVGLDKVRRGLLSREDYLQQFGYRSPHEAEMYIPRPVEDPRWLDEQLAGLDKSPADVESLLAEQRARHETARRRLQQTAPQQYPSLLRRMEEAARLTRLREAARSESVRGLWLARDFALRAGDLTGLGDDIFFLEFEELLTLLKGSEALAALIPARKSAYEKQAALPLYPTIILGRFDPFEWAADPNRSAGFYDPQSRIKRQFTTTIKGLPGSAGRAEGLARILRSPEEGVQFQPGEILVAVTTNVGWTPIFPRATAVVTDVGAPLSHAAIVARELGIPAVVGCFNATTLLKTGDRVRVDGANGTVEILK